jgi:hypothetical protein
VALGFEHCIANLYLLPIGILSGANVTPAGVLGNILPVTLGNIVGGVGLGGAYWLTYRGAIATPTSPDQEQRGEVSDQQLVFQPAQRAAREAA